MLVVLLLILALVAFVAAAFGFGAGRLNLLAVGLALWVLAELVRVWP